MDSQIDFKSVTTSGVAQSKSEKAFAELNEKAKKAKEFNDIKVSIADPKPDKNNAEKALKKLYIQQSLQKISGQEDAQEPTAQDLENERLMLIRKIGAYYSLARFRNRPQIAITAKTTNESLKAEIYDMENETADVGPGLVLLALNRALQVAEVWSNGGANPTGLNLHGITANAEKQNAELVPIAQEIMIKYMDYMPRMGVWGRLGTAVGSIVYHTHKYNTDEGYRKQVDAYEKAERDALNPKTAAAAESIETAIKEMSEPKPKGGKKTVK